MLSALRAEILKYRHFLQQPEDPDDESLVCYQERAHISGQVSLYALAAGVIIFFVVQAYAPKPESGWTKFFEYFPVALALWWRLRLGRACRVMGARAIFESSLQVGGCRNYPRLLIEYRLHAMKLGAHTGRDGSRMGVLGAILESRSSGKHKMLWVSTHETPWLFSIEPALLKAGQRVTVSFRSSQLREAMTVSPPSLDSEDSLASWVQLIVTAAAYAQEKGDIHTLKRMLQCL